jgi:hypothetical protein
LSLLRPTSCSSAYISSIKLNFGNAFHPAPDLKLVAPLDAEAQLILKSGLDAVDADQLYWNDIQETTLDELLNAGQALAGTGARLANWHFAHAGRRYSGDFEFDRARQPGYRARPDEWRAPRLHRQARQHVGRRRAGGPHC